MKLLKTPLGLLFVYTAPLLMMAQPAPSSAMTAKAVQLPAVVTLGEPMPTQSGTSYKRPDGKGWVNLRLEKQGAGYVFCLYFLDNSKRVMEPDYPFATLNNGYNNSRQNFVVNFWLARSGAELCLRGAKSVRQPFSYWFNLGLLERQSVQMNEDGVKVAFGRIHFQDTTTENNATSP